MNMRPLLGNRWLEHTLLGNTFVGKRGQLFVGRKDLSYSAAAWGLDKHRALFLKDNQLTQLVYDTFPKKVPSPCALSLIVVSVVLETTKKIEAQVVMRNYNKFISQIEDTSECFISQIEDTPECFISQIEDTSECFIS